MNVMKNSRQRGRNRDCLAAVSSSVLQCPLNLCIGLGCALGDWSVVIVYYCLVTLAQWLLFITALGQWSLSRSS